MKAVDRIGLCLTRSLLALAGLTAVPVRADEQVLYGLWKLVSYDVETQAGQRRPLMGTHPTGYAMFTSGKRVFFVITGGERQAAKTEAERARLLDTLISYTGTYRVDGDQWVTSVDVAWNPEWVGTEQRRTFHVVGQRLEVLTPWRVMPNWPHSGTTRSIVTFEHVK
jgi:hypothetical protein